MSSRTRSYAWFRIASMLLASAFSTVAVAQVTAPVPRAQGQPEVPMSRANIPIEGWAIVRYSVLADGTTSDVRVIDYMPDQLSENDIASAVESWRFEPARNNGTAVAWHNNESAIVLDANTIPPEPSPMFVTGYREVESMLAEGENEDAQRRNRRLLAVEASRLAEFGVGLVQAARIYMALGDTHAAYDAIVRATDSRLDLLEPSEMRVALQYRNTLELSLGDVVGALETFARREALGEIPANDRIAANVPVIESALASDAAIAVKGRILDDQWSHELARRSFAVGDVDGSLRRIDIDCDLGQAEFEFSDESEWSLPASWGACRVTVSGRRDSEFVLYEFAPVAP